MKNKRWVVWTLGLNVGLCTAVLGNEIERVTEIGLETAVDVSRGKGRESDRLLTTISSEWTISGEQLSWVLGGRIKTDLKDNYGLSEQRFNDYYSDASKPWEIGDRTIVELRNFYLEYSPESCPAGMDSCLLRLGKQQVVWGQADGIKLLDVVNPQSFENFILDDFDDSRIPLWSANFEMGLGDNEFQFLWIVDPTAHFIAEPGRVYGISSPSLTPDLRAFGADPDTAIVVQGYQARSMSLGNSEWGFRYGTFANGWDLSVNYLYKLSDFPAQTVTRQMVDGVDTLTVAFTDRRHHVLGGTLSNTFGYLTFRSELAYTSDRTYVSEVSPVGVTTSDEFAYVIGLDWYGFGDALFSLQYYSSRQLDPDYQSYRDRVSELVTFLYRDRFINDTLTVKTIVEHSLDNNDGLIRYRFDYEWSDETRIGVELNQFYGDRIGIFGQYAANDHLRLLWQTSF